jgi:3-hydroxyacyl-[acyl-carrier-protein] dehydratase
LLLNNLYTIHSLKESENQILAHVELIADHAIFKGHFPGQPVLPGVCMMEMIAEVTGEYLNRPFRISGAPLIKFLLMIDPRKNPMIVLEIKYQSAPMHTSTSGKIFSGAQVFMKFQMNLSTSQPSPGSDWSS